MKTLSLFIFFITSLSVTCSSYAFAVNNGTNQYLGVWGDKGHYFQSPSPHSCGYGWSLNDSINLTACYTSSFCTDFGCVCSGGSRSINVPAHAMLCVTSDGSDTPVLSTSGCDPCLEKVKK